MTDAMYTNNHSFSVRSHRPPLAMRAGVVVLIILAIAVSHAFAQNKATGKRRQVSARTPARAMAASLINEAEQLLSELGYWTGDIDGKMDVASRHALVAFQKVERRKPTGQLTEDELEALRAASRPAPRDPGYAHVEVDLNRQVLFVVEEDGSVSTILPISSGNGEEFTSEGWTRRAVTPTGRFTVSRKFNGVRKAPLGLLYYPNYFVSGVAIHGAPSVPAYPDSHGCVRIPVFAAKKFSEMIPVGTVVVVHNGDPADQVANDRKSQK